MCSRPVLLLGKYNSCFRPLWHRLRPVLLLELDTSVRAKKYKVRDEVLPWEEFSQANYRMLGAMRQQEWPDNRLKMVRDFWVTLETHFWCHDSSEYRRRALLVYQGRVRKDWHKMLGMADAFHLLPLNAGRLNDYHQELLDNAYVSKIEAIRVSTSSPPMCIPMLTFSHLSPILPLLLTCVFRISSPTHYPILMLYAGFSSTPIWITIRTRAYTTKTYHNTLAWP